MDSDNILGRIQENIPRMSKSNQMIAHFVLHNVRRVPFMTITEMSGEIGVSTATISRFSQGMGFGGFWQFQKQFEQILVGHVLPYDEPRSPVESCSAKDELCREIGGTMLALSTLYSEDLAAALEETARLVLLSRGVLISGGRTSRAPALHLLYALKETGPNVFFLENVDDDFSSKLQSVSGEDMLLAIAYPPYSRFTTAMAEYAKKRGAAVAAITDGHSAPICRYCDIILPVKGTEQVSHFAGAITVINALTKTVNRLRLSAGLTRKVEDALVPGLDFDFDDQEGTYDAQLPQSI